MFATDIHSLYYDYGNNQKSNIQYLECAKQKWEQFEPGVFCQPLGNGKVRRFIGKPHNKKMISFLVHPLDRYADYKFLATDEKTRKQIEKFLYREEKPLAAWKKELSAAYAEKRPPNFRLKPKLVETLYNGLATEKNLRVGLFHTESKGVEIVGDLILVPFLADQITEAIMLKEMGYPDPHALIIASVGYALKIAKEEDESLIAGLGALISVITQTSRGNIFDKYMPVTSGNDLTASGIVEGVFDACRMKNVSLEKAKFAIIGATGSVGRPVTEMIMDQVSNLVICARDTKKLNGLKSVLEQNGKSIQIESDINMAVSSADVVIIAISSTKNDIELKPDNFNNVKVICDASRPMIIDEEFAAKIPETLIFEGAIFKIPGYIHGYEFLRMGEPNHAYGCLSATIARGLAGCSESCGNGIYIPKNEAMEIFRIAKQFGITPIGVKFGDKKIIF